MNRRDFVSTGVAGAVGCGLTPLMGAEGASAAEMGGRSKGADDLTLGQIRALFPRTKKDLLFNAAGGTPLGQFAVQGLDLYRDFWRWGREDGHADYVFEAFDNVGGLVGDMIGAKPSEIALVHSTKAGEQIVLDGIPGLRDGGKIVTNDLHFVGCLHNLIGQRSAGVSVEIVKSDHFVMDPEAMIAAIDDGTTLVSVTLVSNVNGHIESVRQIADAAHAHGALVYADVIQAVGIVPFDVRDLGIDFAACDGYKWLYGPYGAGFLYVAEEHQGTGLADHLFPGNVGHNYAPWVDTPVEGEGDFIFHAPETASRYQPGHVSYIGYCAAYESLKFLNQVGVENCLARSVELVGRIRDGIDPDKYELISPHTDRSPIISFLTPNARRLSPALREARADVSVSPNRIRISPAIYNTDEETDRLLEILNAG